MAHPYIKPNQDFKDIFLILRGPNYYDSPEGTKPFEKIWGINKYCIWSSLLISVPDCLLLSQTSTVMQTLNTVAYWMVPSCALATTFAATTFMATHLRGKDDKWNYSFGVACCIPVLHAIKPTNTFVIPSTIILFAWAMLKKDSVQNGWKFFPKNLEQEMAYWHDYSLVKAEWPRRPY